MFGISIGISAGGSVNDTCPQQGCLTVSGKGSVAPAVRIGVNINELDLDVEDVNAGEDIFDVFEIKKSSVEAKANMGSVEISPVATKRAEKWLFRV